MRNRHDWFVSLDVTSKSEWPKELIAHLKEKGVDNLLHKDLHIAGEQADMAMRKHLSDWFHTPVGQQVMCSFHRKTLAWTLQES